MTDENIKGPTTAFCTFTPFKSSWARLCNWVVLKGSPVETHSIRQQRFLHYLSFIRVSPTHLKRASFPYHERLRSGALLFISAYNGSAESYFRGFNSNLSEQMNSLWNGCVDWRGAEHYEPLNEFIAAYRRRTDFHFNAYPDTSSNLRVALQLRAEVDELIELAQREPKQFLRGYRRMAQVVWGKPCGEGSAS